MNDAAIIRSIDAERDSIGSRAARHLELAFRSCTVGRGGELGADYLRWLTREAHPMGNLVVFAGPASAEAAEAAAAPLVSANVPAAALFPVTPAADAARALVALGFKDSGAMPAMAVNIERLAPAALPAGYALVRVGPGKDDQAWVDTFAAGYGLPPRLAQLFSPNAVAADDTPNASTQCFAIVRDGRTVATSMLFLADGLAGVYCVATLPEERGKGLGAHATAEALRVAGRMGYGVGVLQSTPAGHSLYRKLGFADVGTVPMFVRMPQ